MNQRRAVLRLAQISRPELNAKGKLIGIEILGASAFIRDSVLDSVQAKVLDLAKAKMA